MEESALDYACLETMTHDHMAMFDYSSEMSVEVMDKHYFTSFGVHSAYIECAVLDNKFSADYFSALAVFSVAELFKHDID